MDIVIVDCVRIPRLYDGPQQHTLRLSVYNWRNEQLGVALVVGALLEPTYDSRNIEVPSNRILLVGVV